MDIWTEIKASVREGSVITRLIYVNIAIFLAFRILNVAFFLSGKEFGLLQWFELPADISLVLRQPWSLLSYMFLHFDFLHILFNLLVLYWFGRIFLDYYNQNQLLGLYLLGGLAGGVVYIAAFNIFPVFAGIMTYSRLLGASASIIAILIATAIRDPNREISLFLIGSVRLKYIAIFFIVSYIIGISTNNAGGNFAHLGGAVMGCIFAVLEKKERDITAFIGRGEKWITRIFKKKEKIKIVHKQIPRDDYEYNREKAADHEELNRILDKIGTDGYDSLSKKERETLFRHGK
jgi:membrane associated rhomboid family serine protease